MNKVVAILAGIAILAAFAIGLIASRMTNQSSSPASSKIQIAASFYPLGFFAQTIGGDKVNVTTITPAGAEPHDYEPTSQDIAMLHGSRMIILNGGGLEPWGERVKQTIDSQKTLLVVAGEGLISQKTVEQGQTIIDPHVWLSPPLAREMAEKIAQGYETVDPEHTASYKAAANALEARLDALDRKYRSSLASCTKKDFITSHAAFGYLASSYHLRQIPIAGLSPDAEPSPRQLADLAEFAKQNNIKYIFFESLISPKLAETIAQEVGAKTLVLNPLEGLTPEELKQGNDYFTEMEQNLTNLKTALECNH